MKQLPDTYNIFEIQCLSDSSRLFVDRSDYDRLEEALAAKAGDFDRLCKDFDAHDAELKRIITGLRAELAQNKPKRSSTLPAPMHGPCNFEYWRIIEKPAETPAELVARHMTTPSVLISAGGEE